MGNGAHRSQARESKLSSRFLLTIYVPTVAVLAAAGIAAKVLRIDPGMFTRDPAHIAGLPFYSGLLSDACCMVWCAGAVLALFGAWVLPRTPGCREQRLFLLWVGGLTLYMMIDDVAMFHDDIWLRVFHTYEQVVLMAYLPVIAYILMRFRPQLRVDRTLVVLFGVFLAMSFTMDQWHLLLRIFHHMVLPDNELLEDGSKILAAVTWMGYLARRASDAVLLREAERAPAAVAARGGAEPTSVRAR